MSDQYLNKYIEHTTHRAGTRYYCPYCGKDLKRRTIYGSYDARDFWYEYFCDCDDAKKEQEIMKQIKALETELPKVKYKLAPSIIKVEYE